MATGRGETGSADRARGGTEGGREGERNGGGKGRFWFGFTGGRTARTEAYDERTRLSLAAGVGFCIFPRIWRGLNTGGLLLPEEGDGVVGAGRGRSGDGGGGDVAPGRLGLPRRWGSSGVRVAVAALDVAVARGTAGRNEYVRAQHRWKCQVCRCRDYPNC